MFYHSGKYLLLPFFCSILIACDTSSSSNGDPAAPEIQSDNTEPADSSNGVEQGLTGPLGGSGANGEYSQFTDSPFANLDFSSGYFFLEDFEDQVLENPGASASNGNFASIAFGPTLHDSVDADDGSIDGSSLDGESWTYQPAVDGVTWSFSEAELDGQLPTHVGIVWTDGAGEISFEAFDANGESLGRVNGEHANASFNGETLDDRFYGVIDPAGISSIKLSSPIGGIEMDHLQWGFIP